MLTRLSSFAARSDALHRSVDVWLFDPAALVDSPFEAACLDAAEHRRLAALRFDKDRALYRAAHVCLRHLLSLYRPAVRPEEWAFDVSENGRPEIAGRHALGLRFSLSHTAGLVAIALTQEWDVGVDIEGSRAGLDVDAMTSASLSATERRWFGRVPADARESAFMGVWTIKEALLKAHGIGIGEDLCRIALVHSWSDPRAVLTQSPRLSSLGRWNIAMGRLAGGYSIAVAASGPLTSLTSASSARRRLALFDLRGPTVPAEGRALTDALFLPVAHFNGATAAAPVPSSHSTEKACHV